ncbi:MAG TPA: glycosyltransferase [Gallionella sp.]
MNDTQILDDGMQNQLHIVANASIASGGEGLAAFRYAEAVARAGADVTLLSRQIPVEQVQTLPGKGSFDLRTLPAQRILLKELYEQYRFVRRLCEKKQIRLIHLHGMWTPLLAVAAMAARRMNIPFIVSPHGCLEPWALGYKRSKKWIALKTYQGAVLRSAALLVATAGRELESIRLQGLQQPVAIIPNGVEAPPAPRHPEHEAKTILFLSRIHPIKGLLDLVNAWAMVRRPGWRILIAGGDEAGYRALVEARIREHGLQADFEFAGFVEGARKQACFEAADLFILPTYSENFGIAVAEALANEIPVITTTGAPWEELAKYRCGWWVEPGVQGISGALREALDCGPEELREMGRRGRQLVLEKYTWKQIGETALEVSEWMRDRTRIKPECINLVGQ